MSLRHICFVFLILLFSCSNDSTPTPLVATLIFTANGITYNWKQVDNTNSDDFLAIFIYKVGNDFYALHTGTEASTFPIHPKDMSFFIESTNLSINTPYTYTTTDNSVYGSTLVVTTTLGYDPSTIYRASELGDFVTISFTKIHDNKADGNFNGRLTRESDLAKITVTNGTFLNVDIQN